jgi:hypothetical protein
MSAMRNVRTGVWCSSDRLLTSLRPANPDLNGAEAYPSELAGEQLAQPAHRALIRGDGESQQGSKGLHTYRTLAIVQVAAKQKAPLCGAFAEPSDGLEPSTPSLPCAALGNQSQPTATVFACFGGFSG